MTSDTVVPPLICAAQVKAESGVTLGALRPTLTGKRPTPAGAAIAGPHHIGISAIRGPVTMDQDVFRVTLSVIIAVVAAERPIGQFIGRLPAEFAHPDAVPLLIETHSRGLKASQMPSTAWRCALADASLYEAKRRRAAVREMMA